jgi:hypothetical protein
MFKSSLVLLMIVWTYALAAEDVYARKFDVAISLGEVCQPALALRERGMRWQSFPFDWLVTPFHSLVGFIAEEGADFLLQRDLVFNARVWDGSEDIHYDGVKETRYGCYLCHDFVYNFKAGDIIRDTLKRYKEVNVHNHEVVKQKYDRRIQRFFDVLRSQKKVLFIRLGITKRQAALLTAIIDHSYPNLEYLILYQMKKLKLQISPQPCTQ